MGRPTGTQPGHPRRRRDRPDQRDREQRPHGMAAEHREHPDDEKREEQVELLLDGEAPGVLERRVGGVGGEVVGAGRHPSPVGDVEERGAVLAYHGGAC